MPSFSDETCSSCGGSSVDRIIYGFPGSPPERGERLGGCLITPEVQPDRICNDCGHSWATPKQVEWHQRVRDSGRVDGPRGW